MIGRIRPASIKAPIWISCSRLGSTINQTGRTPCAFASAKQARVIKEGLPGRQSCQRNGGGLHKVERAWFGDKLIGEGKSKFCLGPIATIAEHGIDLGAFDKRSDPRTYLLYHS